MNLSWTVPFRTDYVSVDTASSTCCCSLVACGSGPTLGLGGGFEVLPCRARSYVEAVRGGQTPEELRHRADTGRSAAEHLQTPWSLHCGACCSAPPCCSLMFWPLITSVLWILRWSRHRATLRAGTMVDHRPGPWILQVSFTPASEITFPVSICSTK